MPKPCWGCQDLGIKETVPEILFYCMMSRFPVLVGRVGRIMEGIEIPKSRFCGVCWNKRLGKMKRVE